MSYQALNLANQIRLLGAKAHKTPSIVHFWTARRADETGAEYHERLKEENALEWTERLNNIRAYAREIVTEEIIFA